MSKINSFDKAIPTNGWGVMIRCLDKTKDRRWNLAMSKDSFVFVSSQTLARQFAGVLRTNGLDAKTCRIVAMAY